MTLNGNSDETNGYNSVAKNGEVSNVNFIKSMVCPIGSVVSWLKTFTNTPSLPDGWVECDGATLSDADSPFNGQVIPDLNGGNRFLRGDATSGGTGGSNTMAHFHTIGMSSHSANLSSADNADGTSGTFTAARRFQQLDTNTDTYARMKTSAESENENRPPYYNVVFIMRVK